MANRAQRRATKRTKLPPRRVYSDDLVIVIDGQEYRPHAGEWVEFQASLTVDDFLTAARLQRLRDVTELSADELADLNPMIEEAMQNLARSIVAWNWTNNSGQTMPSPPDVGMLRGLSFEESGWLIAAQGGPVSEEAQKNGSAPST